MTILAHPQTLQPTFPTCPGWCDQYDQHDPHGEIAYHRGIGTLEPRVHEIEYPRVRSAAVQHLAEVDTVVRVFREDGGSYNGEVEVGVPTAEVVVFEHRGHSAVFRPTASELRALAAAYVAAADLLDGVA